MTDKYKEFKSYLIIIPVVLVIRKRLVFQHVVLPHV